MNKGKKIKRRQVDIKETKQIRVDFYIHKTVKISAGKQSRTIKEITESALIKYLNLNN